MLANENKYYRTAKGKMVHDPVSEYDKFIGGMCIFIAFFLLICVKPLFFFGVALHLYITGSADNIIIWLSSGLLSVIISVSLAFLCCHCK